MHVRLPKPLHGWRPFAGEVGIIVLGVLIALGLEHIASSVRDRANAREAHQAVYAEIKQNLSYMKARMATQACVERRLDEIGALLEGAGDGALFPRPKWIGQPAIWFNSNERWQRRLAAAEPACSAPTNKAASPASTLRPSSLWTRRRTSRMPGHS